MQLCSLVVLTILTVSVTCRPNRIMGGTPTTVEQFPAVVQIEFLDWAQQWFQACAGSVITSRNILSSAQCFDGGYANIRFRRIRAGATTRNHGGIIREINFAIVHFNHHIHTYDADITMVRLRDPLVLSSAIRATSIPPQGQFIPDNLPVTYVGWGAIYQGGPATEVLLRADVFTVNRQLCHERYAALPGGRPPVTENNICAGLVGVGGAGACQGDSGAPLYFGDITIGIASWREECGNASLPSVSTAVASYTDWIVSLAT